MLASDEADDFPELVGSDEAIIFIFKDTGKNHKIKFT